MMRAKSEQEKVMEDRERGLLFIPSFRSPQLCARVHNSFCWSEHNKCQNTNDQTNDPWTSI
jgi:hypothetical protein